MPLSQQQITKWKGTIGIVGNPRIVAKLNKEIIRYGNSIGLFDDQHFPEILAVGIDYDTDIRYLQDQVNLCRDFGCDVIALPQIPQTSSLLGSITSTVRIAALQGDLANLARSLVDQSIESPTHKRPDLIFTNADEAERKRVADNLHTDQTYREKRISDQLRHGGYPILSTTALVGIIGGAGPLTSAEFALQLADKGTP
ncbi:MAG: hypothetical protein FJX34_05630, partial [Alphaproteobacteria bacterium]|nr:hypothetical protein [Alphaproteobacteria bacterium]